MEIDKTFPTFKKIYHNLVDMFSSFNTYKEIFLYLTRVLVYLMLYMIFVIAIMNAPLYFPMVDKIFDYITKDMNPFEAAGIYVFLAFPLCSYLSAKFCGLFKKINHLNIFFAILIIVFVDIFLNISINTRVQLYPRIKTDYYGININDIWFLTTFNFIVFKFFNFLTKKFPIPFERIGYYTSIEFMKDVIGKLKKS